nr:putative transcriptional regulatory protein [Quercus suber]
MSGSNNVTEPLAGPIALPMSVADSNGLQSRPALNASTSPDRDDGDERSGKRQKVTRACDACKYRKRRCTGELPCSACWSNGVDCTYNAAYTRGRMVEPAPSAHAPSDQPGSALFGLRAASPEAEESTTLYGQYLGPSSAYSFLRRAWQRFGSDASAHGLDAQPVETSVSVFAFGDRQVPAATLGEFRLPDRTESKRLVNLYFDYSMPTYRFLHRETVLGWLLKYHAQQDAEQDDPTLKRGQETVVLMVLATAVTYSISDSGEFTPENEQYCEQIFQLARRKLADESGKVMVSSVQARLAVCLYLMSTSRPNEAWYTLGSTIQMMFVLGMHRSGTGPSPEESLVRFESRKRAFWAASTLDTYLSVILGRPALINEEDIDQKLPRSIEDAELAAGVVPAGGASKDSVIAASILHAKLARIVKRAAREQYSVTKKTNQRKVDTATKLNAEIASWQTSLPVILSGAIHPSSLMPVFRRQIQILQLANAHAVMLVNRPLLLQNGVCGPAVQSLVSGCVSAARSTLEMIRDTLADKMKNLPLKALWMTQYVTFTALSVVYVFLIQRKRGRSTNVNIGCDDDDLIQLADSIQTHLKEGTRSNAPSLRYSIVLEELQQEARRLIGKAMPSPTTLPQSQQQGSSTATIQPDVEGTFDWDGFASDFPLDSNLWMQLDSFPFSKFQTPCSIDAASIDNV